MRHILRPDSTWRKSFTPTKRFGDEIAAELRFTAGSFGLHRLKTLEGGRCEMKLFVKSLVVAGALFGASLAGLASANAMPIAPTNGLATAPGPIETVGWRCGPGWHVNPWGRCVPNGGYYGRPYGFYGPRPVYRPYGYGPRPVYRPYARPYGRPYGHPYYRHW
jgi:hypothetical protein